MALKSVLEATVGRAYRAALATRSAEGTGDHPERMLRGRLPETVVPKYVRERLLGKVLVGLVLILLLNGIVGGFFYWGIGNDLDNQTTRQVESTTALQASVYNNWFEDRQAELAETTQEFPLAAEPGAMSNELADASADSTEIRHYHFVDSDSGRIVASSDEEAIGRNVTRQGVGGDLFDQRLFVVPSRYNATSGAAILLGQRTPFLVDDYVIAEIPADSAGPEFDQPIEGMETAVVSTEGNQLLGPPVEARFSETPSAAVSVTRTEDAIVAHQQLQSAESLVVVTTVPRDTALDVKDAVLQSFLVTLFLTFAILVGVTIVGGRSTIRDLNRLAERAESMGEGELDVDLTTQRDDEVGVLYQAFDEMRRQLRQRITDAETSKKRAEVARQEAEQAREEAERARTEAERAREQTEQFNRQLQVLDRILRHNLQNEMNVITLEAQNIKAVVDGRPEQSADAILEKSESLLEKTEKQRTITRTLSVDSTLAAADAVELLETVLETLRTEYPAANLTLDGPAVAHVKAVPNIEDAFRELVENAIEHTSTVEPAVHIDVTADDSIVRVAVSDDGPGIPDLERQILTGEMEIEPLHHSTGIGMWLIYWLVRRSGGSIIVDESGPDGSRVTVVLESPSAGEADG